MERRKEERNQYAGEEGAHSKVPWIPQNSQFQYEQRASRAAWRESGRNPVAISQDPPLLPLPRRNLIYNQPLHLTQAKINDGAIMPSPCPFHKIPLFFKG